MKRLDQITMREYIDIRCGEHVDGVSDADAAKLISEYQEICDPAGMKSHLHRIESGIKEEIRLRVLNIIAVMLKMGYTDDAREVFAEYSGSRFNGTDEKLNDVVKMKIRNIEFSMKRKADLSSKEPHRELTNDEIRRRYDEELASLISYHKMQISIDTISASVYAHLVCNTSREIRARMASVKKTR